jgi:hypothetical protein
LYLYQITIVSSTMFTPNCMFHFTKCELCTICWWFSTPTCRTKIHIVIIFKPCLICHYGLYIPVQLYMDVQLDSGQIKVKGNPLVYIMRWMLERGTHLIDMAYAVKGFITEKLVKLDNICYFFICFKLCQIQLFF